MDHVAVHAIQFAIHGMPSIKYVHTDWGEGVCTKADKVHLVL